jgi:hypothetical protein
MTRRRGGEGEGGNRAVSPLAFSGTRGDLSGASEPQARESVMVVAGQKAA